MANPKPSGTARSSKAMMNDRRYDKRHNIAEASGKDKAMDKKRGVKD